jgi:hypothetical protein
LKTFGGISLVGSLLTTDQAAGSEHVPEKTLALGGAGDNFHPVLITSVMGDRGFIRLIRMVKQRDELSSRVLSLKESNAHLADEIHQLRDDPATIENLARTELGMVRDGETVYILNDRPGDLSP